MSDLAFLTPEEKAVNDEFLARGYAARPVGDRAALDRIRDRVAALAAEHLGLPAPADPGDFLNRIHERVDPAALNALRLHVIRGVNAEPWLRPAYFRLARATLETVAGNELCMQRRVNLSVQLPGDDSSLLPVHADAWSGDSPFEVVVWLPLVDVFGTKTMYLAPPAADRPVQARMAQLSSAEAVFREIEPHVQWIALKYGEVLVFNQNLMHGNVVNREPETRWTMNCRFKSVLSPFADKKLGEFFEPITLRAATRFAMDYTLPGGFDE
ncbi:MAG TPA: sporadic carbohydrate cluster 2OG-Fe(II) oxygenase [Azospirillum sp.]